MGAFLWPLLIYWMVVFIACYTIVEVAQDQLYDEVTPRVGLKVTVGSLLLALLMTWLRPSFDTMFTSDIAWTALQAIAWFAVFTLIFQFHPPHAAGLGLCAMLIIPGLATMGVDGMLTPKPAVPSGRYVAPTRPVRSTVGRALAPPAPKAQPPAKTPAAK